MTTVFVVFLTVVSWGGVVLKLARSQQRKGLHSSVGRALQR